MKKPIVIILLEKDLPLVYAAIINMVKKIFNKWSLSHKINVGSKCGKSDFKQLELYLIFLYLSSTILLKNFTAIRLQCFMASSFIRQLIENMRVFENGCIGRVVILENHLVLKKTVIWGWIYRAVFLNIVNTFRAVRICFLF